MPKIKITKPPKDQTPHWVCMGWVGLTLPIAVRFPPEVLESGILDGKPGVPGGYSVETTVALKILEKENPRAAQWWRENIPLKSLPYLTFQKETCEFLGSSFLERLRRRFEKISYDLNGRIWHKIILVWRYRFWIRKNELHSSLYGDRRAIEFMTPEEREVYYSDLCKRREKAHERDLEREKGPVKSVDL